MKYSLDNVKCKYPSIVSSGTFDEIIKLLNTLNEKEKELSTINAKKIELESEVESLKAVVNDFRPLVKIISSKSTKDISDKSKEFDSHEPLAFGIISSGEGNTRIG